MRAPATIASFICIMVMQAQMLSTQGVDVTVTSGAQLTVRGDVLAGPGSALVNAGMIDLSGDLTNDSGSGLFAALPGEVVLNGTSQTIAGGSAIAFDVLDLQCASVTLQQDVVVGGLYPAPAGVLKLRNAIMHLNTHRVTVNNAAPAAITRMNGHIMSETDPLSGYGEVEWRIGANTGSYAVPFGTGTQSLPVTLDISSPGVGNGSFVLATYPTDPFATPNNRPLPAGVSALIDPVGSENAPNVLDRYWPVTTFNFTSAPTASLTFTYRDSEWNGGTNTIMESSLQAQHFNGVQWSQPPNGIANTTLNTLTTAPTGTFDFVWALVQGSTPLPVELLYFGAEANGDEVLCHWVTATEFDNDFFSVERSSDGINFHVMGEVDGAGNSQTALDYEFHDEAPLDGLSYYRLRQTDLDGTATWSDVVAVRRDAPNVELVVHPNPCRDELFIAGGALEGEQVSVLDATGRVVVDLAELVNGSIDVSALPSGSYAVRTTSASGSRLARFVKQ